MASEAPRIALIGAGRMGRVHLGALRDSAEIELAGVVEPLQRTREELAAAGLRVYAQLEDLLERDPPDGVLIAAPADIHLTLVGACAAAGIPMLCEKPLGVRAVEAAEAARRASEAGVVLQVGYWRRFVPELCRLRERIASGELGEISQLTCAQWDTELPTEAFRARSGGICADMGVHEFDQVRWLVGQDVRWVAAAPAGPSASPRVSADPDCATILAQLSGGASAVVSLGRRFPYADSCWLEVWGTEGYERLTFMWDRAGQEVFARSMRRQAEAFARALRGGRADGAGGEDAVAALSAAEAAAASLSGGGSQVACAEAVPA